MMMRSMMALAVLAALTFATAPAMAGSRCGGSHSSDCVKIDFRGYGGKKDSYTFTDGSMSVTATGGTFDYNTFNLYTAGAQVGQYSHGLGVTNGRQSGDAHTVDAWNNTMSDVLILTFNTTVKLSEVYFGWSNRGDEVQILNGDLDTVLGTYSLASIGGGYYKVEVGDFIGSKFGIRAPGHGDSYKVKGVKVCDHPTTVIPTPAAGLAGMSLLGLVIAGRRRFV